MFIVFPRFRLRISILALPIFICMLWLEGGLAFTVMMLSALIHELGHLLAAKLLSYRIRRVDILPMGALIVLPEGIDDRDEAIIAASGPIASLLAAVLFLFSFLFFRNAFLLFGAVINATLGIFNLLPVKKLDGGKALCCFLSYKGISGKRICAVASLAAKAVFIFFAVFCFFVSGHNFGVALITVSLLLQL